MNIDLFNLDKEIYNYYILFVKEIIFSRIPTYLCASIERDLVPCIRDMKPDGRKLAKSAQAQSVTESLYS